MLLFSEEGQKQAAEKEREKAIPSKKSPPESCDKEGRTAVAAFRPWRGSSAFNPQSLTEARLLGSTEGMTNDFQKNSRNGLHSIFGPA